MCGGFGPPGYDTPPSRSSSQARDLQSVRSATQKMYIAWGQVRRMTVLETLSKQQTYKKSSTMGSAKFAWVVVQIETRPKQKRFFKQLLHIFSRGECILPAREMVAKHPAIAHLASEQGQPGQERQVVTMSFTFNFAGYAQRSFRSHRTFGKKKYTGCTIRYETALGLEKQQQERGREEV